MKYEKSVVRYLVMLGFLLTSLRLVAQAPPLSVPTSVSASAVLDAAGPKQRQAINNIYLVVCPVSGAGSGFLLETGVLITNSHVVGECTENNLFALDAASKKINFKKIVRDSGRDLAALVPI